MARPTVLENVQIISLTRMRNDTGGNPRWVVVLSDATQTTTAPGAQCAHVINNVQYQRTGLDVELRGGEIVKIKKHGGKP